MDVFSIGPVCYNHRHFGIHLWSVDVASYQSFEALKLDRDVLLKSVSERFVVDDEQVISDLVWHVVFDERVRTSPMTAINCDFLCNTGPV